MTLNLPLKRAYMRNLQAIDRELSARRIVLNSAERNIKKLNFTLVFQSVSRI